MTGTLLWTRATSPSSAGPRVLLLSWSSALSAVRAMSRSHFFGMGEKCKANNYLAFLNDVVVPRMKKMAGMSTTSNRSATAPWDQHHPRLRRGCCFWPWKSWPSNSADLTTLDYYYFLGKLDRVLLSALQQQAKVYCQVQGRCLWCSRDCQCTQIVQVQNWVGHRSR